MCGKMGKRGDWVRCGQRWVCRVGPGGDGSGEVSAIQYDDDDVVCAAE